VTSVPDPVTRGAAAGCPSPRLVARGVCHAYGHVVALDDVSASVGPGAVVGLLGPNGSGKTTLLLAVSGLVRPDAGSLEVEGAPAGSLEARRRVVLVPDEPDGLDELTVDEAVTLCRRLWHGGSDEARRAEILLDVFGLRVRRAARLGALSRGLRRRAAMVAALQLAAPLTLIDEATSTLDPEAVVALEEAIRALADRGASVLLATQDIHFAHRTCHEVVILARGRVATAGRPDAIGFGAAGLERAVLQSLGDDHLREKVRGGLAAL
jgi:ABC-type multidrug transport system ATPase subunit